MTENKKIIPETTENKPLTDSQLDKVSGGETIPQPVLPRYTRCSADHTHVYPIGLDACPECGAKNTMKSYMLKDPS